jgi:hypothetical protein
MSKSFTSHLACAAVVLAGLAGLALADAPRSRSDAKPSAPTYRVSGPFTHDNLTIFLLHGDDQIKDKKILTLDEALAAKKVIVHETKHVQKLAIENVSTQDVFVQAGDVVKGGQQDRTLGVDMLVPPKSGKIPIESFCVEQGRWNKRDSEDDKAFNSSKDTLYGNRLKLAARSARNQGQVWRGVGYEQSRLGMLLKAEVKDAKSETSYQLTLENKKLLDTVDVYVKKLTGSLDKQTDVIGYAVVINGKVTSADVYANADLFKKLWPKMLKCSAIEAFVEKDAKLKFKLAKADDVKAFLAEPLKGKQTQKDVTKELKESQTETEKNVLFETHSDKAVLRRSYLAK